MATSAFPSTIEAITPAWLTSTLRAGGHLGDAAVTSIDAEPVGQGVGILCRLYRLTLGYKGDAGDAPRSLVAKLPTADPQTRGMVSLFRFYEREVRFYQEIAERVELGTPRCYACAFDPASGDFILLLEDLSRIRLGDQLAGATVDEAKLAVHELAKLHAAWWQNPRLHAFDWMPMANDQVNKMGLTLYPQAWGVFMERFGAKLDPRMIPIGQKLGAKVNDILDRFATRPLTICHGDFRLDNLFFHDSGSERPLTAIDWQITIRSTGTYDVGYMMSQSINVEDRRAYEREILTLYHDALVERGVTGYSFDQCLEDYRWTLLFCFAYPVMGGGLGDLSNERGYALAETMMQRSASAILDWDAGSLIA
jgi:aminoglycoside/choline kinase family phosphotransferase